MNTKEVQQYEEKRQHMKTALKKRFPSIVSVLAMSDETSKMMKEENRLRRVDAERKRTEKVKR